MFAHPIIKPQCLPLAAAMLLCGLAGSVAAAGKPAYLLQLAAPPAFAPDARIGINQAGTVAYSAMDAADGMSKVFSAACPVPLLPLAYPVPACPAPQPVSFFSANRQFSGASASATQILAGERVSGAPPTFFLRTWEIGGPGGATVLGRSTANFNSSTGFISLANNGVAAAFVTSASFLPVLSVFSGGVQLTRGFDSSTTLRPQIAKDAGTIVYVRSGKQVETTNSALQGSRIIAADSTGYSDIGALPGISADGKVVAFAATLLGKAGINIAVDTDKGEHGEPANAMLSQIVTEGRDGVDSLGTALTQRVGVTSMAGDVFTSGSGRRHRYQLVTVVFSGSVATDGGPVRAGIFSRDALVEITYINGQAPAIRTLALSRISTVAADGDTVEGTTLSGTFGLADSVAPLRAGGPAGSRRHEETAIIGLTVIPAAGTAKVVRARRLCEIPINEMSDYKQGAFASGAQPPAEAPWGSAILSNSATKQRAPRAGLPLVRQGLIGEVGCQLTTSTNITNYFTGADITPAKLNKVLANKPFVYANATICLPDVGPCPGTITSLGSNALPGGDVQLSGVGKLIEKLGGPSLEPLVLDQDVDLDDGVWVDDPAQLANVNSNPLAPVVDFFTCNHEPVTVRVPNCGSTNCSQHFVVARGKAEVSLPSDPGGNMTEQISDPANIKVNANTDLIRRVAGHERRNRIVGVRALSAARIAGASGTAGQMEITVHSPVAPILTDPAGRRFGLDAATAGKYAEIRNAEMVDDGYTDPDSGAFHSHTLRLLIRGPGDVNGQVSGTGDGVLDGDYMLDLTGTGTGPYTIIISSTDSGGNAKVRTVSGMATPGSKERLYIQRASAAGAPLTIHSDTVPVRIPGDVLLHGRVDKADVAAIMQAAGTDADGPDDPMDLDHDGKITALDARKATLLCTKPRCEP